MNSNKVINSIRLPVYPASCLGSAIEKTLINPDSLLPNHPVSDQYSRLQDGTVAGIHLI